MHRTNAVTDAHRRFHAAALSRVPRNPLVLIALGEYHDTAVMARWPELLLDNFTWP
jgi:hypothetical protein